MIAQIDTQEPYPYTHTIVHSLARVQMFRVVPRLLFPLVCRQSQTLYHTLTPDTRHKSVRERRRRSQELNTLRSTPHIRIGLLERANLSCFTNTDTVFHTPMLLLLWQPLPHTEDPYMRHIVSRHQLRKGKKTNTRNLGSS